MRVAEIYRVLVRRYRVAAGLTQEELAALAGLDVRTISDIERGRTTRPHRSTVDRLARALDRDDLAYEAVRARRLTGEQASSSSSGTVPFPPPSAGQGDAQPRQMPAGVRHFTGRADELTMLTRLLNHSGADKPGTLATSVISGTAGVGKTALAVHWAHQVAGHFPDGQLFVNLHGFDSGRPVTSADALAGFLRALGVPGAAIPAEAEERAARYRSLLAGRRMIVVLDNAESAAQVRPLLPGSSSCAAIVTSRDPLAGLVVRDGATRVGLDLLPHNDAVGLLTALIGDRADADPDAAATLAVQCCRLPLALRVAAELAVARADAPLAELVAELADRKRLLNLVEADGDPDSALPVVFSWSYQHLAADAARAFRLVGLYLGPYVDRYGTAALTATTHERAGQLLDILTRAHLIQPTRPSRHDQYEMHDLLRAYAAGQAAAHDGAGESRAALTRLLDHYLHTAASAMDTLYPAERHRRPRIPGPASPTPPMTDLAAARGWLDTHRASLVAAAVRAADDGWPGHSTQLSATLYDYLDSGAHLPEAVRVHSCARDAARQAGDQAAEAEALFRLGRVDWRLGCYLRAARDFRQALAQFRQVGDQVNAAYALTHLGRVDWRQGRYPRATRRQQQALDLFRQAGDRTGEAYALANLARVDWRAGRYPDAITHFRQALDLFRLTGDRTGEARALGSLGEIDVQQGRYPQAVTEFRQARILFRATGDRTGEACALASVGEIGLRQGRYPQATRHLRQALTIFREIGSRPNEAYALADLGEIGLRQGRYPQATRHLRQALTIFREGGDQIGEAQARNGLGEILLATGQPGDARTQHGTALTLASQVGDMHQQARAHCGLGHANHAVGDTGQARHHWQHALTCYTSLGSPEAEQVRTSLEGLGPVS